MTDADEYENFYPATRQSNLTDEDAIEYEQFYPAKNVLTTPINKETS